MLSINRLNLENNPRKKATKVVVMGFSALLIIFLLEIWVVNRLSTYGYKIAELKSIQSELELENQILENQISQKSSLVTIEEKANSLGFNRPQKIDFYKPANIASAR